MNKEYINIDGKAIIIDEDDYVRQEEYYDNLEEVLIQENIIEESKKRIDNLEKEIETSKNKKFFPKYLIAGLITTACIPLIIRALGDSTLLMNSINTIFGEMSISSFTTLVTGTFTIPLSTILTAFDYHFYKSSKDNDKNKRIELEFLKKNINDSNNIIEQLKMNKNKSILNERPHKKEIIIPHDLDKMMEDYFNNSYQEDEVALVYTKKH